MALPLAEPAALAAIRAEAATNGNQQFGVIAAGFGAVWNEITSIHAHSELAHSTFDQRITVLENLLTDVNNGSVHLQTRAR